jgi:hypothetical protein
MQRYQAGQLVPILAARQHAIPGKPQNRGGGAYPDNAGSAA